MMLSDSSTKIDLIILPWWDWKKSELYGFRTRDGHLLLEFDRHPNVRRVLVVGRPTTPPEILLKRRPWRPRRGKPVWKKGLTCVTQVGQKTFSLDLLYLNFIRPLYMRMRWWKYSLGLPRTVHSIQRATELLQFQDPVLVVWTPLSVSPVNYISRKLVVLCGNDNLLTHPQIRGRLLLKEIREGYVTLLKHSDLVFANSPELGEFFAQYRSDVVTLFNGVSVNQFIGQSQFPVPQDLAVLPKPWIGYAGSLGRRIDVRLLQYLTQNMPQTSFVLLGPVHDRKWLRPLKSIPNVYLLGDKHYNELPRYLSCFDVCILPNDPAADSAGDSIKLYEYLAAGKPVVSTSTAYARRLQHILSVADTYEAFLKSIRSYLSLNETERAMLSEKLRTNIPADRHWDYIADKMIQLIFEKLERG